MATEGVMNQAFITTLGLISRAELGANRTALRRLYMTRLATLAAVSATVVAQSFAAFADENDV
jgi:hypothetical protein